MEYMDFEEIEEYDLIDRYKDYVESIEPGTDTTYKEFANAYINSVMVEDKPLKLVKDRIIEYCDNCGQETEIDRNGGYCEHCNKWLKPCSLCDMDKVNCANCKKFERGKSKSAKVKKIF